MTIARTDKDMAKAIMDELIKAFRGVMGGLVFRQMPDGSVLVSMHPIFHRRTPALVRLKPHGARGEPRADARDQRP